MKKGLLTALCCAFLAWSGAAKADINAAAAESFVKKTTQDGLIEIVNADVSQAEKDKRFEKIFNQALDLNFIGQFVLGRYWRTATPAQRKEFIDLYRRLNVKTWSQRFDEFKGKKFVFKGTSPSSSANQIFVNSVVPMDQGNPAAVIWRVKEKDGNFKIVDIIIENVSLAITARNEYTSYIKNSKSGIDGLIASLKTKLQYKFDERSINMHKKNGELSPFFFRPPRKESSKNICTISTLNQQ